MDLRKLPSAQSSHKQTVYFATPAGEDKIYQRKCAEAKQDAEKIFKVLIDKIHTAQENGRFFVSMADSYRWISRDDFVSPCVFLSSCDPILPEELRQCQNIDTMETRTFLSTTPELKKHIPWYYLVEALTKKGYVVRVGRFRGHYGGGGSGYTFAIFWRQELLALIKRGVHGNN